MPNLQGTLVPVLDTARRMLAALAEAPEPQTVAELSLTVSRFYNQAHRALGALLDNRWVEPAGERYSVIPSAQRATPRGRKAVAYRITAAGRSALTLWHESGEPPPSEGAEETSHGEADLFTNLTRAAAITGLTRPIIRQAMIDGRVFHRLQFGRREVSVPDCIRLAAERSAGKIHSNGAV
jgi:hypothetical protein